MLTSRSSLKAELRSTAALPGFINAFPFHAVAAIHDHGDGWRVEVGPASAIIMFRTFENERSYIVPDFWVRQSPDGEDVKWDEIPRVIERARSYLFSQIAPRNNCSECKECCTTLHFKTQDWTKNSHEKCSHLRHFGCEIYTKRPLQCEAFQCLWLASQGTADPLPEDLRPDKARVILTGPDCPDDPTNQICVHPAHRVNRENPGYYSSPAASEWLKAVEASGRPVRLVTHYFGEAV